MDSVPLMKLLDISGGITAVIGGGGKTTLLNRLAHELPGRVALCTTTRIYPPPFPVFDPSAAELGTLFSRHKVICAARPATDGKLQSPSLSFDIIAGEADYVLVEADGSKGLPLKAHAPHEPVIPEGCGNVICVIGGDCFDKTPLEACHRPDIFRAITGLDIQQPITPKSAALLLIREGLHQRVFLNKAELLNDGGASFARYLDCPVTAGSLMEGWYICLH